MILNAWIFLNKVLKKLNACHVHCPFQRKDRFLAPKVIRISVKWLFTWSKLIEPEIGVKRICQELNIVVTAKYLVGTYCESVKTCWILHLIVSFNLHNSPLRLVWMLSMYLNNNTQIVTEICWQTWKRSQLLPNFKHMCLMTSPHYQRGMVTSPMSQASQWSSWGLNPASSCLPYSRPLILHSLCDPLILLILVVYDSVKFSPLGGYGECDTYI